MLQDILSQIEKTINDQVKMKFGLTEEQAKKTSNVFNDTIHKFWSDEKLRDPRLLQSIFQNFPSLDKVPIINKLRESLDEGFTKTAGLSPKISESINNMLTNEFFKNLTNQFKDAGGNLDIKKMIGHLDLKDVEKTAKDFFDNIGGMFKK
ncbi:MAG: hypothetical protein M9887_11680 [Chitinophagales bacterium]|nr:hypothetical protein [Chitinophagales bacterium]